MALTSGLLDQYWRRYNQRRALTGLPSSYQEQRGMLDPMLEYDAKVKQDEARRIADNRFRERSIALAEQQAKDASNAAAISGVANIGGLLGTGYLGYKSITGTNASNARLLDIMAGKQGMSTTPEIPSTGMFAGPNPYSTPAVGAGSGGVLTPAGVGTPMAGAAPYTGAGPSLSYGAMGGEVGGGLGSGTAITGAGTAAPAGTSAGILGTAGAVGMAAGAYGLQYQTGKMAKPWMDEHGLKATNRGWTYAGLPGAATGFTIDVGKKVVDEVGDFFSDVFGW